MQDILVPTINNNDTHALLVKWCVEEGNAVSRGDLIGVLETSKASFDLMAESEGNIQLLADPGSRFEYGTLIARILSIDDSSVMSVQSSEAVPTSSLVMTNAAKEFAARHQISESRIIALNKGIIRSRDLEKLINQAIENPSVEPDQNGLQPSAIQRGIARVVANSKQSVPHAFLLKKVKVGLAQERLKQFSEQKRVFTGLPDLLVYLLASLPVKHPWFFGTLGENLNFSPSAKGNIGVTFDLGNGLFIPVIKEAASLSLEEISKTMMSYRRKAGRASFKSEELQGGDLSVSINMDHDTVAVIPIILPPQSAMVSLSSVQSELVLGETGVVKERHFVNLGLSYDHRVINGFEANSFLDDVKSSIEQPHDLF